MFFGKGAFFRKAKIRESPPAVAAPMASDKVFWNSEEEVVAVATKEGDAGTSLEELDPASLAML